VAFEKLAVMGAGAVGSIIGAYVTRAGRDITLIDMWPAHVEEMQQRGLKVTAQDEEFTVNVQARHLADVCTSRARFDAAFLAVKSYDSVWATQFIQPFLAPPAFSCWPEQHQRGLGCPGHWLHASHRLRGHAGRGPL